MSEELKSNPEEITAVEIGRIATRSHALSVRDWLSVNHEESRIEFSLAEYNEQRELVGCVSIKVDPAAIKLMMLDIVNKFFDAQSITLPFANRTGPLILKSLKLSCKRSASVAFALELTDNFGERGPNGYKITEQRSRVLMSFDDTQMRVLATEIYDWIRDWETINFRRRQEAQTIVLPRRRAA